MNGSVYLCPAGLDASLTCNVSWLLFSIKVNFVPYNGFQSHQVEFSCGILFDHSKQLVQHSSLPFCPISVKHPLWIFHFFLVFHHSVPGSLTPTQLSSCQISYMRISIESIPAVKVMSLLIFDRSCVFQDPLGRSKAPSWAYCVSEEVLCRSRWRCCLTILTKSKVINVHFPPAVQIDISALNKPS